MATKGYKILNLRETNPTDNPPPNFLYLFPRDGKFWTRNSAGEEEMLGSVDFDGIVSIPVWVDTTTYTLENGDVYVLHNNKIWKLVAATSINEEPGVSMDWEEVDFSELSHMQNTDFKLGRESMLLDGGGTQTFDLTQSFFAEKNYFHLYTDAGNGDATYTLQTVNGGLRKQGQFLVVVPKGAIYTITFQDNAHQKIGIANLELTDGDWALFEGDVSGKTTLIASNKLQGEGGGGNPFDQSLNTTNNVQFAGLKLPAIAAPATETKAVVVDDQGNQGSEELKSINDVVFSQIKIIDQNTSLVTTWQVVDGVLTNVT